MDNAALICDILILTSKSAIMKGGANSIFQMTMNGIILNVLEGTELQNNQRNATYVGRAWVIFFELVGFSLFLWNYAKLILRFTL